MLNQLFDRFTEDDAAKLVSDLVRIPSENPPGNERQVAKFVAEELEKSGFEVETWEFEPNRANTVGVLRGRKPQPAFMLNGHTDVVPAGNRQSWGFDPYGGLIKDGKVWGRGAADMKGGLAAMLMVARAASRFRDRLKGTLMVAAVGDEEFGGAGSRSLIEKGYKADAAIIGEPTDFKVVVAHKGTLWLEVKTRGTAVHSSLVRYGDPERCDNAIYKMARVVLALEGFLRELEGRRHRALGNPTVSVGTISGGTKTNIVPEECSITMDRRLLPGESPEEAKGEIDGLLQGLKSEFPGLSFESRVIVAREGCELSLEEPVVQVCRGAVEEVLGSAEISGMVATTDMSILLNKGGIPTVVLGPGSLSQAHVANESIEVASVVRAAKIYSHAFLKFALG